MKKEKKRSSVYFFVRITRADVIGNKQVQTIAAEVLSLLLSELVVIGKFDLKSYF